MNATENPSTGSKPQSKSQFVRSLPSTLPANEVVERAKAEGLDLSANYVYDIRSIARGAKKSRPKKAAANRPLAKRPSSAYPIAKKATPATKAARSGKPLGEKRAFIESMPKDMLAADLIEAAKKQGIEITKKYIYVLRSMLKMAGKRRPVSRPVSPQKAAAPKMVATGAKTAATGAKANATGAKTGLAQFEGQFRQAVVELGAARCEELLRAMRSGG